MMEEFIETLQAVGEADVLVLAGAGDDFCLGRDQWERPAGVSPKAPSGSSILTRRTRCARLPGISVALVQGRALGFGCGLALQCDLVLAADTAALGFDEISHGFPPLIVSELPAVLRPRKVALDLVLTGRRLPAHEAQQAGMVSRVVPAADLGAAGAALTEHLCSLDPDALRRGKSFFGSSRRCPARSEASSASRRSWRGKLVAGAQRRLAENLDGRHEVDTSSPRSGRPPCRGRRRAGPRAGT